MLHRATSDNTGKVFLEQTGRVLDTDFGEDISMILCRIANSASWE